MIGTSVLPGHGMVLGLWSEATVAPLPDMVGAYEMEGGADPRSRLPDTS